MRYVIIEGGRVANAAEAEAPLEANWLLNDDAGIGDLYEGGLFRKPPPNLIALAAAARRERNALLQLSDWTQLADTKVDQAPWAAYRQALRDIPSQPDFPLTVEWPTAPQ
jgi:hypothetical protein